MSRIARIVLEGVPYHVTQRGNARQQVFFDERDYELYLDLLRAHCEAAGLRILAYCLMPNHVHLIAVPERPNAMASALGRTHADFARHFNLSKRACGHVWQARYFSCPLDGTHLWQAMAYIERNPVRARMVEHAAQFPWSSAPVRLGTQADRVLVDVQLWRTQYTQERWNQVLESSVEEECFGQRLQEASRRGRPLATEQFVRQLERQLGRDLRPLPVGRPRTPTGADGTQLSFDIGV